MSIKENALGVVFVIACAFVVTCLSLWVADPDVFWHLKVGEWIVENRAVPDTDVYSWSAHGQPWTAHQWLWEVLMYLVHEKFGIIGLWAMVFVCASIAGLLIQAGMKEAGNAAAIAGGAAPFLSMGWLKPWPQAGVYALFSVYLYLSMRGKWGFREIAAIAAIALTWANIHSSAAMLPLLLLAEAVWRIIKKENFKPLVVAALVSKAATLINPQGPGLWIYVIREGLLTKDYKAHIAEWMPFFFGSTGMAISFFICAAILIHSAHKGNVKSLEFSRAAGFWALALLSRIYMPYAVLSTATLLKSSDLKFRLGFIKVITVIVLLVAVIMVGVKGVPADLDESADKSRYPVQAVKQLHGGERLFNDYGWGGYLIWKGVPVYIDGRADLYRHQEIFKRYIRLYESDGPISQYIEETGADTALVIKNSLIDMALRESSRWKRTYMDDTAVIYKPAH